MSQIIGLRTLVILGLVVGLSSVDLAPSAAATLDRSTSTPKSTRRPVRIRWTPPPPPPNLGDPGNRGQGGGSRGDCAAYQEMAALVPKSQWGLTTLERPTLWLSVPQGLAAKVPLELVIQDDQGEPLFKQLTAAVKTNAGIIHLPFPAEAPALQVNQQYRWTVSIYCDAEVPDQPVTIQGSIGRTVLSIEAAANLAQATSAIDKARVYAEQGVWYDALTTLGLERLSAPSNGAAGMIPETMAWRSLLQQAELTPLIAAPLQPCCASIEGSP